MFLALVQVPHFCKAVAMLEVLRKSDAEWIVFRDLDAFVADDKRDWSIAGLLAEVPAECHVVLTSNAGFLHFVNSGYFIVRRTPLVRRMMEFWWDASSDPTRYTGDFDQASWHHTILHFINATRQASPYYRDELAMCHGKYATAARFECRARLKRVLTSWGYLHPKDNAGAILPFCRLNQYQLTSTDAGTGCKKTNAFMCHVGSKEWNAAAIARVRSGVEPGCLADTLMDEVASVLARAGLSDYAMPIFEEGYGEMAYLTSLSSVDAKAVGKEVGMTPDHVEKFVLALQDTRAHPS